MIHHEFVEYVKNILSEDPSVIGLGLGSSWISQEIDDMEVLKSTLPEYNRESLLKTLHHSIDLYRELRKELYPDTVQLHKEAEERVMEYFNRD